jgi:hypothetical protein
MTITHLSHFGLEKIGETPESIIFEGTLGACKKLAFSHGCEISQSQGRILGCDGGRAHFDTTTMTSHWLKSETGDHAGLIQKTRDAWALVLSRKVWVND